MDSVAKILRVVSERVQCHVPTLSFSSTQRFSVKGGDKKGMKKKGEMNLWKLAKVRKARKLEETENKELAKTALFRRAKIVPLVANQGE